MKDLSEMEFFFEETPCPYCHRGHRFHGARLKGRYVTIVFCRKVKMGEVDKRYGQLWFMRRSFLLDWWAGQDSNLAR